MALRNWHRTSAVVLLGFVGLHIANHLAGLSGQGTHQSFMAAVRPIYRHWLVEPLLLALFLGQGVSGAALAVRGWRDRRGRIPWLQALSGLYLSGFLLLHVTSVLAGRLVLQLDTDFRFAAAGLHVANWAWFFAPYYFLAVFSLFAHLGCALYWTVGAERTSARISLVGMLALGIGVGALIVMMLAGALYPVRIPAPYLASYR